MKKLLYGIATAAIVAAFALMALGSSSSESSSGSGSSSSQSSKEASKDNSSSKAEKTSSESKEQSSKQSSEKSENNIYKNGETLDANGLKITMEKSEEYVSDNEFIQPQDGNKYIRVYFTIKNESGKDKMIGSYDFKCYADGESCDSAYFTDSSLSFDELSDGRSTKGYVYYEVPKNAKEIEIEYETSLWTSKKAIFKVEY